MLRLLCLIDTDDRNFYFQSALRRLQMEFPDEICGECFSPMAVRMDKTKHAALMKAADACDFAVVYFHGGCGNLPDFTEACHKPCALLFPILPAGGNRRADACFPPCSF